MPPVGAVLGVDDGPLGATREVVIICTYIGASWALGPCLCPVCVDRRRTALRMEGPCELPRNAGQRQR